MLQKAVRIIHEASDVCQSQSQCSQLLYSVCWCHQLMMLPQQTTALDATELWSVRNPPTSCCTAQTYNTSVLVFQFSLSMSMPRLFVYSVTSASCHRVDTSHPLPSEVNIHLSGVCPHSIAQSPEGLRYCTPPSQLDHCSVSSTVACLSTSE